MRHLLLFLILSLSEIALLSAQLPEQPLHLNYEKYEPENGLPQSYVTGIQQDASGFMWISTLDGLVRYNGSRFQTLSELSADSTGLSSDRIHRMILDKAGMLIIKHVVGPVDRLNPHTFSIERNLRPTETGEVGDRDPLWHNLEELLHDQNANWIHIFINRSFELLDTASNDIAVYFHRLVNQEGSNFYSFHVDKSGRLYLLTPEGLKIYQSPDSAPETMALPAEVDLSSGVRKRPALFVKDGQILIGCTKGLLRFNHTSRQFDLIEVKASRQVNSYPVYCITEDRLGRPTFVFQAQVYRLEPDGSVTWVWQNPGAFDISALLVDRTNTLWIGMDADGLYKVDLESIGFRSYLYSDNFVTDILVREFDVDQKQLKPLGLGPSSPYYLRYHYLDEETILFGIENTPKTSGLYELKAGSLAPYFSPSFVPDAFTLSPDNTLYLMDSVSRFFRLKASDQSLTRLESNIPDSAYNLVVDLQADETYLWAATSIRGIYKVQHGKVLLYFDAAGQHSINTIRLDKSDPDVLWIGTLGGGLLKWSKSQSRLIASYTKKNGLPNNTVNCIVADHLGNIWMSTNVGVSRLDPITERLTNYTKADGLVETEFNRHHQMLLPDGRIALGGTKGYSIFRPETFKDDTTNTRVVLSELLINDQPFLSGGDSLVSIAKLEAIELPYYNNTIGFEYAPTQYNSPDRNQLRYQLVGFDKDWVEIGSERKFRFAQLPFGQYTLRIVSSNTSGKWSEQVTELAITILPPPWRTWWAYLLYALIILLVVRTLWQVYKSRLREKQEAEFNLREAARLREMDEIKTRFFSNVTHEFRTPLTLILSPLEKSLSDPSTPPQVQSLLNNNHKHATQLLQLVNQLLDVSKIENNQMQVSNSAGDLSQFIETCVASFQELATSKGIELNITTDEVTGYYLFDHTKWDNIVVNLVGNAIKFIPENKSQKKVSVALGSSAQADRVRLVVADTGLGIPEDKLPKIFDRFYQIDDSSTRQYRGTGIGLALVKELVDLLDGSIHVSSTYGQGTTFTLELPASRLGSTNDVHTPIQGANGMKPADAGSQPDEDGELPVLLVAEDNDELRSFITESLSVAWKVIEAPNGTDAWSLIKSELPDIVISDVMMPGINGYELCKLSKNDPLTAHISFIMLTARAAQTAKIQGFESGADEYLTKPFHLYELELRIGNILQEQRNLRKHLQKQLFPVVPDEITPHLNDIFTKRLQDFLDEKLDYSSLKTEDIADAMSMSKSTLNRKLKSVFNLSANEFVKQHRLRKAVALLSAGYSVSEVAHSVGFETASYFTQCFKEQFHLTPTEFVKARS